MRLKPLSAPWFADTSQGCLVEFMCRRGSRSSNSFTGEEQLHEGRDVSESQGEFVPAEIGSWFLVMQEAVGGAGI